MDPEEGPGDELAEEVLEELGALDEAPEEDELAPALPFEAGAALLSLEDELPDSAALPLLLAPEPLLP